MIQTPAILVVVVGYMGKTMVLKAVVLKAVVFRHRLSHHQYCRTGSKAPLYKGTSDLHVMIMMTIRPLLGQHLLHHQILPLDVVMVMVPMELELRLEQVVHLQLQAPDK